MDEHIIVYTLLFIFKSWSNLNILNIQSKQVDLPMISKQKRSKLVKLRENSTFIQYLSFYQKNEECENHASWVNLETNLEEIDIIVFPFDATFEQVTGQNNTYVMKF